MHYFDTSILYRNETIVMIKRAGVKEAEILAGLAVQMWTDHTLAAVADEFRKITEQEDAVCFIKYVDDKPVAFAQSQLRYDYVEGTESSPVGYLEGTFVAEKYRKRGYAAELLAECETWAKEKGCTEFAGDCELVNEGSLQFHRALGFEETNRIICFRKDI